ncbi:hypothetical protein TKK_0002859 [Trichogramma kaykai]
MHRDLTVQFSADILNKISSAVPSMPCNESQWSHFDGLQLADSSFGQPRHVDVAVGPIGGVPIRVYRSLQASTSQDDTNLDNLLTKFWTQEEVPVSANASLTSEEAHCENHFVTTHSRDSTGRYVVRLPLKEPASVLGDSFTRARACLRGIISKHNKDPEYKQMYEAFMKEYAQLQHMTQVSSKPPTTPVYYLPHHGVLKLASYLTDQLQPPRENPSTRSYITKMNRQILVDERDVDLQRIVYFDENSNETHWQLKTVTYGIRAAPYLAVRSLLQLVKDEGHRFPSAIDSLTKGRYVDDIFGGAHSDEQLKHVAQDLTDLCMAGGFLLAKWNSNSEAFRADLPDSNSSNTISLDDCKAKIPGLYWDTHEDSLKFKVMLTPPQRNISKRSILSEWLLESEERWPTQRDSLDFANVPEQRRIIAAAVATQDVENYWLPLEKFSSFVKLQRATATVLLACQRLKKLSASSDISIENLKSATHLLIKLTQQHHFASELQLLINGDIPRSHVFNRLTAFIDSQGIIRVGG